MRDTIHTHGHLTWTKEAFPVQSQFSASLSGPWHDTMQEDDKYRRDKRFDGLWGAAFQFRGTDGRPGGDGDPRAYLESINITTLTQGSVKSPLIQGGRIQGAEIWGGEITSGSTIDVTTDVKIGKKLILRADDYANGVQFCHDNGDIILEISVDPAANQSFIKSKGGLAIISNGDLSINGEDWPPAATFG